MIQQKHKGARNELIACTWLLEAGFDVFRNISQHGEVDIVAWKEGKFWQFDVKAMHSSRSVPRISVAQSARGIQVIEVNTETLECRIVENPIFDGDEYKICPECNKPFMRHRRKVYCSNNCMSNNYKRDHPNLKRNKEAHALVVAGRPEATITFASSYEAEKIIAPAPAAADPGLSATDLLARLRGKVRPMANIPTLTAEHVE